MTGVLRMGRERPMKQWVTRLSNGAGGPARGEKLIIYNKGREGVSTRREVNYI